jgi:DNA (cytosine-5)-methyltransferase 1
VANYSPGYCRDVEAPLPTVTGAGTQLSVCEPFLVEYYGTGLSKSLEKPLPTVTTHDRFGIVELDGIPHKLEIRYRMLQPHELSAAMSFPGDYSFVGTKKDVVKQIGTAVPVMSAKQHIKSLLRRNR